MPRHTKNILLIPLLVFSAVSVSHPDSGLSAFVCFSFLFSRIDAEVNMEKIEKISIHIIHLGVISRAITQTKGEQHISTYRDQHRLSSRF